MKSTNLVLPFKSYSIDNLTLSDYSALTSNPKSSSGVNDDEVIAINGLLFGYLSAMHDLALSVM